MNEWIKKAEECGFTYAGSLDTDTLIARKSVRDTCSSDKCRAYGHNWTCPPECGTLEECSERMRSYHRGVLVQTVGHLQKTIDTRGYIETEKKHHKALDCFSQKMRATFPNVLVLGAGGCRVCESCAYPEPCRFPERAFSSMEAYGLFVTQICRDNGLQYYYGEKTITYTGCILF